MKNSISEPTFFNSENSHAKSASAGKDTPLGLQHMKAMPTQKGMSMQIIITPGRDHHAEFDYDSH